MAHCKRCNRKIVGRRAEHQCQMVHLTNGHTVHRERLEPGGDLREGLENGEFFIKGFTFDAGLETVMKSFEPKKEYKRDQATGAVLLD